MTVILWILAVLLLFLLVVLATPMVLELDTRTAHAELRWGWIGGMRVLVDEGPVRYRARVFFVRWTRPFGMGSPSVEEGSPAKTTEKPRTKRRRLSPERRRWLMQAAWNALRAVRVRSFHLVLDTDDVVLNAWLYPIFHLVRLRGTDVEVRFFGGSELAFTIAHSPARILWAMLRA